jgi:acyl homoserine lactone synthase
MAGHLIQSGAHTDARLLDRIYRLRAEVFIGNLGWDIPALSRREIDEYDTEETIYGAVTDEIGDLEGCFRLVPTTGPYMLKDIFPQLLYGAAPPGNARVWEASRVAVKPSVLKGRSIFGLNEITAHLLILQLEYCLLNDIHMVVSVTDLRFERILRSAGLPCERFGPPMRIFNTTTVAGYMRPSPEALASVWTAYLDFRRKRTAAPAQHHAA